MIYLFPFFFFFSFLFTFTQIDSVINPKNNLVLLCHYDATELKIKQVVYLIIQHRIHMWNNWYYL